MWAFKVYLIIFLAHCKEIHGSECDGIDHTFSFTKAATCKYPVPCFIGCTLRCADIVIDGCVENIYDYKIHIVSNVAVLRRGAFRNLPEMRTINMNNTGLQDIEPKAFQNIPRGNEVFLQNNKLSSVRTGVFSKTPFRIVDLTSNEITRIEDCAFAYMPNLAALLLGNNRIEEINGNWLVNSNVRIIVLAHNKLKVIRTELLSKLLELLILDVSFNEILRVEALPNLTKNMAVINLSGNNLTDLNFLSGFTLKYLHVGLNKLSHLDDQNLNSFDKANVEKIFVHPNPWQCICLKKFETLMRVRNITIGRPSDDVTIKWDGEQPICVEDDVKMNMCSGILPSQVESGLEAYFMTVSYNKFIKSKSHYGYYSYGR